jgi:hypothetical protein
MKDEGVKKMKRAMYTLVYADGRNYHQYTRPMSLEKAKAKIAERVARHFAGSPMIYYWEHGCGKEVEAVVKYPIRDDNCRHVAFLTIEED